MRKHIALSLLLFLNSFNYSQYYQEWVSTYNSEGGFNYNDWPNACYVDRTGNTYIAGSMYDNDNSPYNFLTLKLDQNGNIVWSAKYDSVWTTANSVVADKFGNVYVCGSSNYKIIKYNSDGILQWIIREIELQGSSCRSITVDSIGNIYAVGENYDPVNIVNILTAKYNTNGIRQWYKVYSHPANNSDYSRQIKLDKFNNVYVICYSYMQPPSNIVATTIKYNNNGVLQWASIYDGSPSYDHPRAIDIDDSCNVYITGTTVRNYSTYDIDFFTIKYNPNGDTVWVKKYNGPGGSGYNQSWDIANDIKVSAVGNVYITGYSANSSGNYDFGTIKYNTVGDSVWVKRYTNVNSNDYAYSLELDQSGNSIITGTSDSNYLTIKYDPDGNVIWNITYSGGSVDVAKFIRKDIQGNFVVCGYSYSNSTKDDYYAIKYSSNGDELWSKRFSSDFSSNDVLQDMAYSNNNIYVTGKAEVDSTGYDCMTIKYSHNGNLLWKSKYNGAGSQNDEAFSIAVDGSEYIYITGSSVEPNNLSDIVTIKYNSAGQQIWVKKFNGTADSVDIGKEIIVDNSGFIYVCGYSQSIGSGRDGIILKYDNTGNLIWSKKCNGILNSNDEFFSMSIDSQSNVYASGYTNINSGTDYYAVKIDSDGTLAWDITYSKLKYDTAKVILLDHGNLFLAGKSYQSNFIPPYYSSSEASIDLIKYDVLGNQLWIWDTGGTAFNSSVEYKINSVIFDTTGAAYLTGSHNNKFLTGKINKEGFKEWISEYSLTNGKSESVIILLDSSLNPVANGFSLNAANNYDLVTVKYHRNNGSMISQKIYSSANNGNDRVSSAIIDPYGNQYIGAFTYKEYEGSDYKLIKYSQTIGITQISGNVPVSFFLSQNYPNPFNPQTKIKFDVPKASFTKLVVYDLLGREVTTLVNEELKPGTYEADWDATNFSSGVYFYKIVSGDYVETKKMVLMK